MNYGRCVPLNMSIFPSLFFIIIIIIMYRYHSPVPPASRRGKKECESNPTQSWERVVWNYSTSFFLLLSLLLRLLRLRLRLSYSLRQISPTVCARVFFVSVKVA